MKRRYNYLSHLIDAAADGAVRLAKMATIVSSLVSWAVTAVTTIYFWPIISPTQAILWAAGLWIGVWCTTFFFMSSWVGWLVYAGIDEWDSDDSAKEIAPPAPPEINRVYLPHSTGHRLDKEKSSGVGGSTKVDKSKPSS